MFEEGVAWVLAVRHFVGEFADQLFEFAGILAGDVEEFADEKQVEQFFLYFKRGKNSLTF